MNRVAGRPLRLGLERGEGPAEQECRREQGGNQSSDLDRHDQCAGPVSIGAAGSFTHSESDPS